MSVVSQDVFLFSESIKDNIQLGKVDASMDAIIDASKDACADEFITGLEEGYETIVGERGIGLSGGQKQRLTIARAIIKNPEILILDDSSSALDFATDAKLRKAIQGMHNAPTVFIVSQRASSIQQADQIVVLDDGNMVGIGTHSELIENCNVYQEIYYSQIQHTSNSDKEAK